MCRFMLTLAVLIHASAGALSQDKCPPGRSTQNMDGIRYEMLVPTEEQGKDGYSLLIILHGSGGTATGMVGTGHIWLKDGLITCAPKSTDPRSWGAGDLVIVRKIAQHLIDMFEVPEHRRHAAGFSNGGWNLAPVAFDEKLRFRTATWIAAGFNGGKVPKRAAKEMGCLALAGAQDGNRAAALKTVGMLEKKVRFVDCRIQPNLGHAFPRDLVPYWGYVMEVMEGRFSLGRQLSYEWKSDLVTARQEMATKKRGGFVYIYDADADEKELALTKSYQNEVLFGRIAGFFGRQLVPVMLERKAAEGLIAEARVKSTPTIVVFKRGGEKVAKMLSGKLTSKKLASALRAVAKNKALPD